MERYFADNSETTDSTSTLMLNLNRLTESNTSNRRSMRDKQKPWATGTGGNPEEVVTRVSASDGLAGTGLNIGTRANTSESKDIEENAAADLQKMSLLITQAQDRWEETLRKFKKRSSTVNIE